MDQWFPTLVAHQNHLLSFQKIPLPGAQLQRLWFHWSGVESRYQSLCLSNSPSASNVQPAWQHRCSESFSLWVILILQMYYNREVCFRQDLGAWVLFYTDIYQHRECNSFKEGSIFRCLLSFCRPDECEHPTGGVWNSPALWSILYFIPRTGDISYTLQKVCVLSPLNLRPTSPKFFITTNKCDFLKDQIHH